jgi:hypothetical protein
LSGLNIYDFSTQQLEQEGYLRPWEFNIIQSAMSALPATVATAILNVKPHHLEESSATLDIFEKALPLVVPFVLMFTAYFVGWASLWKNDSTKQSRRRAARIYLYLDAAYRSIRRNQGRT